MPAAKPAPAAKPVVRCPWSRNGNELYIRYHDVEWGVPAWDDQTQFEFLILEGEMCVRMNGKVTTFKEGDSIDIPKNTIHSMWNNSDNEAVVRWHVKPALKTEYFLETLIELSNNNKTNNEGKPSLWKSVQLAFKYRNEFRLAKAFT